MRNLTQNFMRKRPISIGMPLSLGLGLVLGLSACADESDDAEATESGSGLDVITSDIRRCIDADPDYDTGYGGDELCLAEPTEDEQAMLVRYGPLDYDDQEDVDRFLLGPGEEETNCQAWQTPNEEMVYTQGYLLTARPGTHHIIVYRGETTFGGVADGDIPTRDARGTDLSFMVGAQSGLGSEGLILNTREASGGDEYEGWAAPVRAGAQLCYEAHYVNVQENDILRESWTRFDLLPEEEVTTFIEPVFFLGGLAMNIPPHSEQIVTGDCPNNTNTAVRIMGLTAHMHAAGTRQTIWKVDVDGNREKIYETFDWEEPINAEYNETIVNPEFNPDAKQDGAISGPLWVHPGERIEWECDYVNETDGSLRFGNGAYDAEMCNVFGFYGPGFNDGDGGAWSCYNF